MYTVRPQSQPLPLGGEESPLQTLEPTGKKAGEVQGEHLPKPVHLKIQSSFSTDVVPAVSLSFE